MNKKKFPLKRWTLKTFLNSVVFILIIIILAFTKVPQNLDSYVTIENFKVESWIILCVYRISMYFGYPLFVSIVEKIFAKKRKDMYFKYLLLENFNIEFLSYALIGAVYTLLGLDKVLEAEIFSSSDSYMFIASFVFTLLLNKSLPNLFYNDEELYKGEPTHYIPRCVDLGSVGHDYDPASNSRTYLSYKYINANGNKKVVIILKNPSQSFSNGVDASYDEKCIDKTTQNVINCIDRYNSKHSDNQYKEVIIINLFPEYSTNAKGINNIYGFKSNQAIKPDTNIYKKALKNNGKRFENADIICAWGEPNGIYTGSYKHAIDDIKKLFPDGSKLLEYSDGDLKILESEYPKHGMVWH